MKRIKLWILMCISRELREARKETAFFKNVAVRQNYDVINELGYILDHTTDMRPMGGTEKEVLYLGDCVSIAQEASEKMHKIMSKNRIYETVLAHLGINAEAQDGTQTKLSESLSSVVPKK